MIKIIADSTCDLSKELIEKYDVTIVPLHIVMDDKEYKDGVEITPDAIYKWADEKQTTPKTSAAGMDDVVVHFKSILAQGDEIVAISISEAMSTTANVFRLAAQDLEAEDKISVVDSANLSTGIGLLVIEAARMAKEGKSRTEIVQKIEELKPLVRSSFVVDTLTYLQRGGRCSSVSVLAGTMLSLHPKIVVKDGKMGADKKYRGKMQKVLLSYVTELEEQLKTAKKERVFITHSGCDKESIDMVYDYLKELSYFDEILVTRAGGVISSHCGPGTLGVLFIAD